jgi:hypothetical protein
MEEIEPEISRFGLVLDAHPVWSHLAASFVLLLPPREVHRLSSTDIMFTALWVLLSGDTSTRCLVRSLLVQAADNKGHVCPGIPRL